MSRMDSPTTFLHTASTRPLEHFPASVLFQRERLQNPLHLIRLVNLPMWLIAIQITILHTASTRPLTIIGTYLTTGPSPDSIVVDPTGKFVIVAHSIFSIDPTTGVLTGVGTFDVPGQNMQLGQNFIAIKLIP